MHVSPMIVCSFKTFTAFTSTLLRCFNASAAAAAAADATAAAAGLPAYIKVTGACRV